MLKRTAGALRTAARQLRVQAQEQRQASSAGGGSTAGVGGVAAGLRPGGRLTPADLLDAVQVLGISAGVTAALGRWNMHQNYPSGYRRLFAYLDRSPTVGWLIRDGRVPDLIAVARQPSRVHAPSSSPCNCPR